MIWAHPESCTLGGLLTAATARSQPATLQGQMASLQVCGVKMLLTAGLADSSLTVVPA